MTASAGILGYVGALVGMVMFGTNYIPVRSFDNYDAAMFQWMQGNGIMGLAIAVQLVFGGSINWYGLSGGAIWAVSNATVLPVVQLLGLGVGFSMYHVVNLLVGYAVGRFGLFGAPLDAASNALVRDSSVFVLVSSFAIMLRVEPHMQAATASANASAKAAASARNARAVGAGTTVSRPELYERLVSSCTTESSGGGTSANHECVSISSANRHGGGCSSTYREEGGGSCGPTGVSYGVVSNGSETVRDKLIRSSSNPAYSLPPPKADADASLSFRELYRSWRQGHARGARDAHRYDSVRPASSVVVFVDLVRKASKDGTRRPNYYQGMSAGPKPYSRARPAVTSTHGDADSRADASASVGAEDSAAAAFSTRTVGVLLAVFAGSTAGVNAVPYDIWVANEMQPGETPLHFLFSTAVGIYGTSTLIFLLNGVVAAILKKQPEDAPPPLASVIRGAYLSGFMWAVGEVGQLIAIQNLGMAEGYVFCAIGPVMLSAVISAVVFKEIKGKQNTAAFCLALGLQAAGVILLILGS